MSTSFENSLLRRLDRDAIARLKLRQVTLPADREIEYPGNPIANLFFLECGIASMTATFVDGFQVEVAVVGWEGVLGASALIGTRRSLNRVYMQIGGDGSSVSLASAIKEFQRGESFHDLILAFLQAQFIQSAQTAGCNAHHSVEQRLTRWLLLCADRTKQDVLPLKHEFVGHMLGVSRSSVSIAAAELQAKGLIKYTRGRIKLLDRPGLEQLSCECYAVVRDHLRSFTEGGDISPPEALSRPSSP